MLNLRGATARVPSLTHGLSRGADCFTNSVAAAMNACLRQFVSNIQRRLHAHLGYIRVSLRACQKKWNAERGCEGLALFRSHLHFPDHVRLVANQHFAHVRVSNLQTAPIG